MADLNIFLIYAFKYLLFFITLWTPSLPYVHSDLKNGNYMYIHFMYMCIHFMYIFHMYIYSILQLCDNLRYGMLYVRETQRVRTSPECFLNVPLYFYFPLPISFLIYFPSVRKMQFFKSVFSLFQLGVYIPLIFKIIF